MQKSTLINEQNWNEVVSNIQHYPFRISEINLLNKEIKLSQISFKYNLQGKEIYYNGSKEASLKEGEYLVAANQSYCEVNINQTDSMDLGVCIDINIEYLRQGVAAFLQPNQYIDEASKEDFFLEEEFFTKYKSNREFHRYMQELFILIKNDKLLNMLEMECEFVKHFLFHQTPFLLAFKNIPAIRKVTRNELFDKMIEAKNILHDSVYTSIKIPELSKMLFLSEYRFFHLFKETFKVSPHRYLLQLKMNEAIFLHKTKKFTWTEIASKLEFADVQSFSKLFKKNFRMSPKEFMTYT